MSPVKTTTMALGIIVKLKNFPAALCRPNTEHHTSHVRV